MSVTKCANVIPTQTTQQRIITSHPTITTQTTQLRITPSHPSPVKVPLFSSSKAITISGTISNPTAVPEVGIGLYIAVSVIAVFGMFFLVISLIMIVALCLLRRKHKAILTQTREFYLFIQIMRSVCIAYNLFSTHPK